jgi:glucokinase
MSIVGIDIGGTKIAVVVGTPEGEIIAREQFPSEPARGPDEACDRIAAAVSRLPTSEAQEMVGVSAPGPLSSRLGMLLNPPNMPSWHNFPLRDALQQRLGRPVRIMNDANASALAEWRYGAGKGRQTMVFYTMSTGMGAGLIIGGRLHEGADDMAGEVGHLPVSPDGPVGFGRRGSLEGFCSGPGLSQLAIMKLHQARHEERDSLLFHQGKDYRLIDATDVGQAARQGDAIALAVYQEVGEKLGQFSAWVVDLLNPDAIVVGTIGRIFHDLILPYTRQEIERFAHRGPAQRVDVRPAALGQQTGDLAAICAALT